MLQDPRERQDRQRIGFPDAVVMFFVLWFGANLHQLVYLVGGPPPVFVYLFFIVAGLLLIGARAAHGVPLMTQERLFRTREFWFWWLGYFAWIMLAYLNSSQSEVATQALISSVELALILALFMILFCSSDLSRPIAVTFAVITVVGSVLNIYDFWSGAFSEIPWRGAGLYLNPNYSGFFLVVALTISMQVIPRGLRWPLVALVGVAVFLTLSRSAWLVLAGTSFLLVRSGQLGGGHFRSALTVGAAAAVSLLAYGILSGTLYELISATPLGDQLSRNALQRLGLVSFATDHAAVERQQVAEFAFWHFSQSGSPLLGSGIGVSSEWDFRAGPHNMFLLFLTEGGLIAVFLYAGLLYVLWRTSEGVVRIVPVQVAMMSFFSHNILTSPSTVLVLAIVASGSMIRAAQPRDGLDLLDRPERVHDRF